ncbi:hypothetical protein PGTUg99_008401 [Puccinia graminis f. sp. tritici]|uniref:Uncharacterized protein n=1 Tax=Puccinia graminis f. sp. tritici TaxID=56615 RepID=A0A5B0S7W4_PUCGR|nr:hypothetical protein PGTUg99_008401 [Puccinia graminis f. sp. tritici]
MAIHPPTARTLVPILIQQAIPFQDGGFFLGQRSDCPLSHHHAGILFLGRFQVKKLPYLGLSSTRRGPEAVQPTSREHSRGCGCGPLVSGPIEA